MAKAKIEEPVVDELAQITERIKTLRERKFAVIRRSIELERSGAKPIETPGHDLHVRAQQLLNGDTSSPTAGGTPDAELARLNDERAVLERAIELAEKREFELQVERQQRRTQEALPQWFELQRERVAAVAKLQELNRKAIAFERSISYVSDASLPAGGFVLLGPGDGSRMNDEGRRFISACASAGILT